jgi:hypothetical protein
MPFLVCQPGTGLCVLLAVVAPLLIYQPSTGLCVLFVVAVLLLLPGCNGHAVQIVSLAVSGKQPVPGGGVHNSRSATNALFCRMCMRSYREVSCTVTDG